jgi:hypothetical protein
MPQPFYSIIFQIGPLFSLGLALDSNLSSSVSYVAGLTRVNHHAQPKLLWFLIVAVTKEAEY